MTLMKVSDMSGKWDSHTVDVLLSAPWATYNAGETVKVLPGVAKSIMRQGLGRIISTEKPSNDPRLKKGPKPGRAGHDNAGDIDAAKLD